MDVSDIIEMAGLQDIASEAAVKLAAIVGGLMLVMWAIRLAEKSTWLAVSAVDGGMPDSGAVPQSFLGDYDVWTAGKGKGVFYQKAGWLEPKHAQSFEHLHYQLGYSPNKPKRANRRRSNRRRGRRMSF